MPRTCCRHKAVNAWLTRPFVRVGAPILLVLVTRLISGAGTNIYRHENLTFQYPTGWRIEERQGVRAFSVMIYPPNPVTASFYIGTRQVPIDTDGAVQHEEELRAMMKVDPNWTRLNGPLADKRIPGRTGYESALRKTDEPVSQLVYSIVKNGRLVVIAYTFHRNTSIEPSVFTLVSDSLAF